MSLSPKPIDLGLALHLGLGGVIRDSAVVNEGVNSSGYSTPSPMSTNSGDLLHQRQPLLANEENGGWSDPNIDDSSHDHSKEMQRNGGSALVRIEIHSSDADHLNSSRNKKFPKEKKKTLLALLFLVCNFIMATVSLALTHERLPRKADPLPDIFLDKVTAQDWALSVSEILIIISTAVAFVVMMLHVHRWIVFRRTFFILGILYFMRSITMYVTVLPKSSYTYHCDPPANSTAFSVIIKRVIQLSSGFGLSINGQQTFCGDYIYSGHTVILVTACLIIKQYTSAKVVWLKWVHWISWLMSVTGIVMVLVARGHYTIDVLVAYYVTTRVFWIYHTLAHNHNRLPHDDNFLSKVWWYSIFKYLEGNVGGALPNEHDYPWSNKKQRLRRSI